MSNLPNVNTASEQQAEAWTQAAYVWILGVTNTALVIYRNLREYYDSSQPR